MKRNPHKYFRRILIPILLLFLFSLFDFAFGQENPSLKKCWEFPTERILNVKDASDNDLIFISSLPDTIQTFDLVSNKALWKSSLGGEIISKIIVNKQSLIILNESVQERSGISVNDNIKRTLVSLDSASGIANWKTTVNSKAKISLYSFENILALVEENGVVSLVNLVDGKTFQTLDIKREISAIHRFKNSLIFGTRDKKILFFSVADGKLTREISMEEVPENIFVPGDENIIWADQKGAMRFVNVTTRKTIWKKRFGGEISSIAHTSSGLLISSFDNFVYLVDISSGKIKWKKRLAGRIIDEPLAVNEMVLVFAYGDSTGLILNLNNGKVIDLIPLSDSNQFTGKPIYIRDLLIFPTLKGLFAFSSGDCSQNKKTDK
jgi:outer membrane protein assembly factor BamB